MLQCSADRPWGLHAAVRNDSDCPRCGWTAPGPVGDARADALAAHQDMQGLAARLGWTVHEGGAGEALAA